MKNLHNAFHSFSLTNLKTHREPNVMLIIFQGFIPCDSYSDIIFTLGERKLLWVFGILCISMITAIAATAHVGKYLTVPVFEGNL